MSQGYVNTAFSYAVMHYTAQRLLLLVFWLPVPALPCYHTASSVTLDQVADSVQSRIKKLLPRYLYPVFRILV